MITREMDLSLNGDTFEELKNGFDRVLYYTLLNMERRQTYEATVTVKLKIKLEADQAPDYQANGYDAKRDIIKPKFTHEIVAAMQVKDKLDGEMAGDYELVYDKEDKQYRLRPLKPTQASLLDEDVQTPPKPTEQDEAAMELARQALDLVEGDEA